MKYFLILLFLLCFCLTGCGNNDSIDNSSKNNNYTASRTTVTDDNTNSSEINNVVLTNSTNNINNETELSSFSTKIYTPDDESRQTNIRITCSKLNETVVKSGETFSFCNTVGKATPEEGYQKADVFDKDGNIIKGYGGGNCQISSTLYNALLVLPNIEIIERHNHSKEVYYVPMR